LSSSHHIINFENSLSSFLLLNLRYHLKETLALATGNWIAWRQPPATRGCILNDEFMALLV